MRKGKDLFKEGQSEFPFLRRQTIRQFDPMESWYVAWPDFDRERRKVFTEKGFTHVTKTDITAYFENIDLRHLDTHLRSLIPREGEVLALLTRILEAWTRATSAGVSIGRGIPQGNDVSSFLANLYLMPLDAALKAFCKRRKAVWYRYVDDVEVYSREYATAREAVFVINEALRSLYLNLQGSKTEIIEGQDLARAFENKEGQAVEAAWDEIQRLDCRSWKEQGRVTEVLKPLRPCAQKFRRGLPGSVRKIGNRDSRLLRRLMTIYGRCGRPWFLEVAFAALRELPELRMLTKCLRYLSQLRYPLHHAIVGRLLTLIEEDQLPIPYQAACVVETIGTMHPSLLGSFSGRLRDYGLRKKRSWIVRQKIGEALATFPGSEVRMERDAERLLKDEHPWVRRAGCVLLSRAGVEYARRRVRRLIYHPDQGVGRLALFWSRHLDDKQFAIEVIYGLEKGSRTDHVFLKHLPQLWLLRCNPDPDVVRALRVHLLSSQRSASGKVIWHRQQLIKATRWVDEL